ncbi:hypothetical protein QP938_04945 [Porticoccaceae bacterium LTM1]|nr:hypothetical protein QP938_04945 [Porticoccaceae bacterium LTM1]
MKHITFLLILLTFNSFACNQVSEAKEEVFAKIIRRDSEAVDIVIVYPDKFENAKVESFSFVLFQDNEFFMYVDSSILKHDSGAVEIDLDQCSWSYIAVKESALDDIEIVVSYRWPPTEDGTVVVCGPEKRHKLSEIIKN